jgi:hypothetical protein
LLLSLLSYPWMGIPLSVLPFLVDPNLASCVCYVKCKDAQLFTYLIPIVAFLALISMDGHTSFHSCFPCWSKIRTHIFSHTWFQLLLSLFSSMDGHTRFHYCFPCWSNSASCACYVRTLQLFTYLSPSFSSKFSFIHTALQIKVHKIHTPRPTIRKIMTTKILPLATTVTTTDYT